MFDLSNCFVLQTIGHSVLTNYTSFKIMCSQLKCCKTWVFVCVPIRIKVLNIQQRIEWLFNVLETYQYKIKLLCFSACCI
jgi:hypothetical protein